MIVKRLHLALEVHSKPRADHSLHAFLEIPGWLSLNLFLRQPADEGKLEPYDYEGSRWSIDSGIWVHPLAPSILTENEIDGIVLDTTFKVIRLYYTAILVAVYHNVGIPIAFTFGGGETEDLYNTFSVTFQELFGIDLKKYILESDQGSALKKIGKNYRRHLFCLRHVLKNLEKTCGRWATLGGNLIRCRAPTNLRPFWKCTTRGAHASSREVDNPGKISSTRSKK
jgi:hypothetical protein